MALRGAQQKQATEHRTVNTKQRKSNTGRLGVAKPVKARSMHTRRVVYVKAQQSSQQQTDQGEQSKDVFETPGTLGEKEARFLEALRSFYYDGRPMISNEEFDSLKDELTWQGSRVIQLNGTEQRFLEAYKSYNAGKPVLSDEEYDELKRELQRQNSPVVMQGPRCSIRTQRVYSDASVDYFKEAILNVPGAIITLLILFLFDAATSYRVTYLVELPEPYSFLFTWGVVIPGIYYGAVTLTNFAIKDPLILKGPCPNCGEPNWTFFGSIFNIESNKGTGTVECGNCKAKMDFNEDTREIVLDLESLQQGKKGKGKGKGKGKAKAKAKAKASSGDDDGNNSDSEEKQAQASGGNDDGSESGATEGAKQEQQ